MKEFFQKNWLTILICIVIVMLVVTNVFTFYFLLNRNETKEVNQTVQQLEEDTEVQVEPEVVDDEDEVTTEKQSVDSTAGQLQVEWRDFPRTAGVYEVFNYNELKDFLKYNSLDNSAFKVLDVGKIKNGEFADKILYVVQAVSMGMGGYDNFYRVIFDNDKTIILTKVSDELYEPYDQLFVKNNKLTIAGLDTPDKIKIPNSNYELVKADKEEFKIMSGYYDLKKMFEYETGKNVYFDNGLDCFVVAQPDGSAMKYYLALDFLQNNIGGLDQVLKFNWLDGSTNTISYLKAKMTGCGGFGCYNVSETVKSVNDLQVVGQTKNEGPIYEFKDFVNNKDLKGLYDSYYPGYDSEAKKPLEKIPYEEFIENKPLIFWQDPFGNFLEFRRADYLPAVECGKPVIYLYPEKTMNINVDVQPEGGFKITEPAYDNGWKVQAQPNGSLLNLNDRKVYPYLFWEGYGYRYARPDKGFVIAKNEVEKFLNNVLADLGLVQSEINDFNEFWLPKMQDKPYYFITFVPQTEFDKIAPLTVQPKPDKVIRVFMDYEGLDQYKRVEPLKIIPVKRKGFTVVEWGGAIHK